MPNDPANPAASPTTIAGTGEALSLAPSYADGHPWRLGRFPALMPRRVEEILLVSSPYDSFILEEDGLLTELIYSEYSDLGLTHAPNVTRVPTAGDALAAVQERSFDLVIAMPRLGDMAVDRFRAAIQEIKPDLPVIMLVSSEWELQRLTETRPDVDTTDVFVWHGDAKLFVAIIKMLEDRWNIDHDTRVGGVGAVIIVEDSAQFRSVLLPLIYSELVKQSRTVLADGINRMHRLLRMRARPKVLLAATYEAAVAAYQRYRKHLFGVIADVAFPREGRLDPQAGIRFIREVRQRHPDLPTLLQSSDIGNRSVAESVGSNFLHKKSPTLIQDLRDFMLTNFGFGDFIFRTPDGREVARASDLRSLVRVLEHVPAESIEFHASRNHFSNWLRARTEFDLAKRLRPRRVSEYHDLEALRRDLIRACHDTLRRHRRGGVIEDFSHHRFDAGSHLVRIGSGSLGGKARGLAFIDALLARHQLDQSFPDVHVCVPHSVVIGTDVFDRFIESNNLWPVIISAPPDADLRAAFLRAELPHHVIRDLRAFLRVVRSPVAVRSSSLLEDSQYHPFAGVYDTLMIPNNHDDERVRLQQLSAAIKLVYASTYDVAARRYLHNTPFHIEEQKMGVILQPVVGRRHGHYFYPSLAGTARSFNYYPYGPMRPEEGTASVALGLGSIVVSGGASLRFCPAHPHILPQLAHVQDFLNQSQRTFLAIDLSHPEIGPESPDFQSLVELDLDVAEEHGTLGPLGSTWSPENEALFDGIARPGVRVVTFAHILKSGIFPLAEILARTLDIGKSGMNAPVDIEFAANLDTSPPEFVLLQIRPCANVIDDGDVGLDTLPDGDLLCRAPQALGHGVVDDLTDIVYVKPDGFDPGRTVPIAEEVGRLNDDLAAAQRPYLLIGPGRWGSSNRWLGIPVNWSQISLARVIIETSLAGFVVDPSQGSHFFHNLTSFGVAYLTVNPGAGQGFIDWDWLAAQPAVNESDFLRHVRLAGPLEVRLDGHASQGAILKHRSATAPHPK